MKMVEVITGLRALTPDLRAHVDELLSRVQEANNLSSDAKNCVSREAMRALILPLSAALSQLAYAAMSVDSASARLESLVNGYTRQFTEESGAPVDDPRQPDLPGIDDDVLAVGGYIADAASKSVTAVVRAAGDEEDPED